MNMVGNEVAIANADATVRDLVEFSRRFTFPCVDKGPLDIARESVEDIWLKTAGRKRSECGDAYLRWAEEKIPIMSKSVRYVINQQQFDILVRRTGEDLLRAWRDAAPERSGKLSYGAAYRVVDFLFMAIDESSCCRHDTVRRFLHVPLDAVTLKPLKTIIDELVDLDYALEIPAAIPPGFVATEEQYVLLQGAISSLARRARIPPIIYAYWCAQA
jgi:hypothetical protein